MTYGRSEEKCREIEKEGKEEHPGRNRLYQVHFFADKQGDVVSWSSSGCLGFKGSRKSTPFAAQKAVAEAAKKAMNHGMRKVEVKVKGPGPGREAALRALQVEGFDVSKITDVTPLPHNGCKPPKRRRV
jgi:small subunit ribosomal protein S11